MTACELEPAAHRQLVAALRRDRQARVVKIDGWMALPAYVPPQERRGVVLVDPPFEQADEFERLAASFEAAYAKWPTGIFILWYPLKDARAVARLGQRVADAVLSGHSQQGGRKELAERYLRLEFQTGRLIRSDGLTAAGLIVANPPWTLEQDMAALAPALGSGFGHGRRWPLPDRRLQFLSVRQAAHKKMFPPMAGGGEPYYASSSMAGFTFRFRK